MEIRQFVAEALGDASYLVASGRSAAVVDPQRDVRPYLAVASELGATIETVFETHVHNDYLSGARELAARGAEILLPAGSGVHVPHRELSDAEETRIGGARFRAVFSPGHTRHHMAYLAIDERGATVGAFTGGSLIIGGAGRTDLLGENATEELTRLQWESVRRLVSLLDGSSEVLPTHGAGSFCSVGSTTGRRATLAEESPRNLLLASPDYESLHARQLGSPAPIPAYYRHMAPLNCRGPRVFGEPPVPAPLEPGEVRSFGGADAVPGLLDVRPRLQFARAHIPSSLSIEEGGSLLAFLSWMTPFNAPLALVTEDAGQAEHVALDLFRIGYEDVRGYLPFARWQEEGLGTEAFEHVEAGDAAALSRAGVPHFDVRFASELEQSPLPGARSRPFERISEWIDQVSEERVLLSCSSGVRATAAASMLSARGIHPIVLIRGGADDLLRHAGRRGGEHGHA